MLLHGAPWCSPWCRCQPHIHHLRDADGPPGDPGDDHRDEHPGGPPWHPLDLDALLEGAAVDDPLAGPQACNGVRA